MDAEQWTIALDSWIIQDGNYPDFDRGQHAEFAVEFWPTGELDTVNPSKASALQLSDSTYQVCGEVVLRTDHLWVIDCGLMVFQDSEPLDELLPAERTGSGSPSTADFALHDLTAYVRLRSDDTVEVLSLDIEGP